MKFIVSSTILQKQLASLSGVVPSNPVIPILENFLFEIEPNKLTVSASDLQISMTTEVAIDSTDSGSIAVPAKKLLDTLKELPEQPITITIEEQDSNSSIEITSYNGRYKLSGEPAEDYPKIPVSEDNNSTTMSSEILANAINNTLFAISTDELRPAMTGMLLALKTDKAVFVSTDGHRLIRYTREDLNAPEEKSVIIPRKALALLKSSLPAQIVEIQTEFTDSHAFFAFENMKLSCRLIDENYPDYENAIPQENENELNIDRLEFLNSLKRLAIYANQTTQQIRLKLASGKLEIHSEDTDFANEASESLLCDYNGDDMEIGFNVKFLLDILGNLHSKDVKMKFSTPNKAGIALPSEKLDEEDILMLVMPVMLNTYVEDTE